MYFLYGKTEVEYLKGKDKILGAVIDEIGHVDRETDTDLFSSVVHHIIGQQISTKAQATIWQRMKNSFGDVNAAAIAEADISELQSFGMTFRKAEYIQDFAKKVQGKEFDLQRIAFMPDAEAIKELASLKGIGVWTAEMILLFCLQRPDIFSFDDLAIQRGLRKLNAEEREMLDSVTEAMNEESDYFAAERFIRGYCLGALMMLEVMEKREELVIPPQEN